MKSILQTLCVMGTACGMVVEHYYEADVGFVLITMGALAFAISTKIEKRKKI